MLRVMIVDDSAVARRALREILESQPDIRVVCAAANGEQALEKLEAAQPDVITLDIEMPGMGGLEFLDRLMALRPTPVVVVSVHTPRGGKITIEALFRGAVDFVTKPSHFDNGQFEPIAEQVIRKIRAAAHVRVGKRRVEPPSTPVSLPSTAYGDCVVAIGASTGGPAAISELLSQLPENFPPVLIAQHMPAGFTRSFAERLDSVSRLTVKEAENGEKPIPGVAYVAPGDWHLLLEKIMGSWQLRLTREDKVHHQRPSVDMLFWSVAQAAGSRSIGVLLTGMGEDGAAGLLAMRKAGARTIAEDESSCLVFGMPKAAISIGAVEFVLSLREIPSVLSTLVRGMATFPLESKVG